LERFNNIKLMTQIAQHIPAEWKIKALSEVCDVLIGGTPSRNKPEYWDKNKEGKNVWISIRDLSKGEKHISDSSEYISDQGVKASNVKPIPKGIVLMSFKLTIGRVAITDREVYTNEAIAAFLVKENSLLDSSFLYYALPGLQYDTDTAIKGATLNKEKLKTTKIVLPSLSEQTRIATILSKVDEEIEKVEQIIGQTEKLKKGLMQKLLTKGIGHTKFKQSELGEIPEEWEVVRIDENVKHVGSGATPRGGNKVYTTEGIPFIRSQNVHFGSLNLSDTVYISKSIHEEMRRSKVEANDVLLNITGASIGRVCVVPSNFVDGNVNQHVCIIRPNEKLNPTFLSYFLESPFGQNQIFIFQAGGNREGLNFQQIRSMKIPIPTLNEQKQIVEILESVSRSLFANQKIKAQLLKLKKGLMNDLLSGKVRVI
jgi:type I restriction enzyme, S subunit